MFAGAFVGGLPTWTLVKAADNQVVWFNFDGFPATVLLFPSEQAARFYDRRPDWIASQFPDDGTLRQMLIGLKREGIKHVGPDPTHDGDIPVCPIDDAIARAADYDR